jgi:diguanylate cyclase (GGDEF)-like protein/PAS domain S-box-containing protein
MTGDLTAAAEIASAAPQPRRPSSPAFPTARAALPAEHGAHGRVSAQVASALLQHLPDPVLLLEDAGHGASPGPRATWANPVAADFLGWDATEFAEQAPGLSVLAPSGDLAQLLSPVRISDGQAVLVRRCGDSVGVSATVVPLMSTVGRPAWGVIVRPAAESTLDRVERHAEQRLTALAQNLPVGIAFSEVGLRLGYVNDALARLLGRPGGDLLGTGWLDLLEPYEQKHIVAALDATAVGDEFEQVLRLQQLDGEERWLATKFAVVPVLDGATGFVATFEDITENRRREASLSWEARHDLLTGLANRQGFEDALREVAQAQGSATGEFDPKLVDIAVILLDVDDFKMVNDRLGHDAGDQFLLELASRLRVSVRETDFVCRLSGDEFAVLCYEISDDQSCRDIADRLLAVMRDPVSIGRGAVTLSASIGAIRADGTRTAREMLRDADIALTRAKREGKNCAVGPALDAAFVASVSVDPIALLGALRDTLADGRLRVDYQPIRCLDTGQVVSVEALARWDGPDGPVPPAVFIPMAETAGLIGQLGEQVLRQACSDLARWRSQGDEALPHQVCVNISAAQLGDPAFPVLVSTILDESRLPASALCLELTEQVAIADLTTGQAALSAVQRTGVRIALDDFGTGYSSLTYLHRLPVDVLKLDRSFTAALEDPAAAHIVRCIAQLGAELGLTVVAEGIEQAEQAAALQRVDCRFGQGYLLGRPASAKDLVAQLRADISGSQFGESEAP